MGASLDRKKVLGISGISRCNTRDFFAPFHNSIYSQNAFFHIKLFIKAGRSNQAQTELMVKPNRVGPDLIYIGLTFCWPNPTQISSWLG